jgi:hypothetical protein
MGLIFHKEGQYQASSLLPSSGFGSHSLAMWDLYKVCFIGHAHTLFRSGGEVLLSKQRLGQASE